MFPTEVLESVKERMMLLIDEWTPLAGFLGEMIEKYISQLDIDSLPDPDEFFQKQNKKDCLLIQKKTQAQKSA